MGAMVAAYVLPAVTLKEVFPSVSVRKPHQNSPTEAESRVLHS
jgi:hypothetical protein